MPFSSLGLHDRLVQGVRAAGFDAPTPIQLQSIPRIVEGKDLVAIAQTGTGKTAAFMLPMLHKFSLSKNRDRAVRGLVLTPTRELAKQIEDAVTSLGRFTNIGALSVYGGVSMENQIQRLRRGVDIVIATPGRLLDHLQRRTVSLENVEVLVLDEADRMFDMGFINDVREIVQHTPQSRQTLLFSATMPESIRQLTQSIQKNPERVQIGVPTHPAPTVTQRFYAVRQANKLELLAHVIEQERMKSVLVFARTKRGADRISRWLERKKFSTAAIHSNRTQAQRQQALAGFGQRRFRILVATDIAARGIDVQRISHVINFDTPVEPEDYIHRIGRTGRASLTGEAITFVSDDERKYARRIEQLMGKRIALAGYPGFVAADKEVFSGPIRHRNRPHGHNRDQRERRQLLKGGRKGKPQDPHGKASRGRQQDNDAIVEREERHGMHIYAQSKQCRQTTKSDWMALLVDGDTTRRKVKRKFKKLFAGLRRP